MSTCLPCLPRPLCHGHAPACRRLSLTIVQPRFHTGQTITLSVLLGAATMWYTWQSSVVRASSPALAAQLKRESLRTAVLTGTIYWIAGFAAILFPNTSGLDPEFGGPGFPQAPAFFVFASLGVAGWLLESVRG